MKLKRNLILSLLGGAMLALPMTAPTLAAEPDDIHSITSSQSIGGGTTIKATATDTPIMVGIRATTSTAVSGMRATVLASSRRRCGEIAAQGILPPLKM